MNAPCAGLDGPGLGEMPNLRDWFPAAAATLLVARSVTCVIGLGGSTWFQIHMCDRRLNIEVAYRNGS